MQAATRRRSPFPSWFRSSSDPDRAKWLAFWLLVWNAIAATDAFFYTFRTAATLDNYLGKGTRCKQALAQSRMLANCQWALILSVAQVARTGDERTLKRAFVIMICATLGAFRSIYLGVEEGSIVPPWEGSTYTMMMSLSPLLLLGYFAFVLKPWLWL